MLCVAHLHTAVLIIYDLSPRWLHWTLLLLQQQKGKKVTSTAAAALAGTLAAAAAAGELADSS